MLKRTMTIAVAVMAVFGGWSTAQGAGIVEDTQLFGVNQDDGSVTLSLTDFTIKDDDLLVVSFSQEHNDGAGGGISSVKYGGLDMNLAVGAEREDTAVDSTNTALSSIWFIDPSDGTSDITLNSGVENIRFIASVMYVSGTSGVVESSDTTEQDSVPVTTGPISVSAGALVVDAYAFPRGGTGTINSEGLAEHGGTLLQKYDTDTVGGGSAFSQFGTSYLISNSELPSLSTTWDHDNASAEDGAASLAVASFAEIPEPATATLFALTAVALLRRRRR